MKNILKKLLNPIGFDIVRYRSPLESNLGMDERLGFELEDEATDCISLIRHNTMLSKRRLVTLYQQVAYCERHKIPGVFVECGVWKGGAMGLMALANLKFGETRRHLHLFDSFKDICEPDASIDGKRALDEVRRFSGQLGRDAGKLKPVDGFYTSLGGPGTLDENKTLIEKIISYPPEYVHYHVGWFQDTLPKKHNDIHEIAILRLDGDWYASTKVCLDYLYDKVVRGGIIIIDDYGTYEGCRKAVDEFMARKGVKSYLAPIDRDCRYMIKVI